jgi:hypothetical protein
LRSLSFSTLATTALDDFPPIEALRCVSAAPFTPYDRERFKAYRYIPPRAANMKMRRQMIIRVDTNLAVVESDDFGHPASYLQRHNSAIVAPFQYRGGL